MVTQEAPWSMGASVYQARQGVHEPWIAEISPWQYANLSGAAKRRYDAKRAGEWDASANCKSEWRAVVMDAYDAGTITLDSPEVCEEAQNMIKDVLRHRAAEDLEEARKAWHAERQIESMADLAVGMQVWSIFYHKYGLVLKKNVKTCKVEWSNGRVDKQPPQALLRQSWDDSEREFRLLHGECLGPGVMGQVFCKWKAWNGPFCPEHTKNA